MQIRSTEKPNLNLPRKKCSTCIVLLPASGKSNAHKTQFSKWPTPASTPNHSVARASLHMTQPLSVFPSGLCPSCPGTRCSLCRKYSFSSPSPDQLHITPQVLVHILLVQTSFPEAPPRPQTQSDAPSKQSYGTGNSPNSSPYWSLLKYLLNRLCSLPRLQTRCRDSTLSINIQLPNKDLAPAGTE